MPPTFIPLNGKQRRDNSKCWNMLWLMNSEMEVLEGPHLYWKRSQKKYAAECVGRTAVPKATFSTALTVMDKVGGWNEEEWVGSKLAANMSWAPASASEADAQDHHGMCKLGKLKTFYRTTNGSRSPTFSGTKTTFWKRCIMILTYFVRSSGDFCGSPHLQASVVSSRSMARK